MEGYWGTDIPNIVPSTEVVHSVSASCANDGMQIVQIVVLVPFNNAKRVSDMFE